MKDDFCDIEEELRDKRELPEPFDLLMFVLAVICLALIIIGKLYN